MRLRHLWLLAAVSAGSAQAAVIAPHRAIYDLKMVQSNQGAALSSIEGRLAFEVVGTSCDGWTVSFRMVNRFVPTEGPGRLVDTQSTSFESGDGTRMDYSEKEFVNQKLQAETRIKVSRSTVESAGEGRILSPKDKVFELPMAAAFPMQHQLRLMDKAAQGEQRDTSVIFDGSDGENAFRAITFIGKEKPAGENRRDQANAEAAGLSSLRSWPVSISYYSASGDSQDVPAYQIGFDLYENGVATGLKMDYGQFKLEGQMKKLELLPVESCN